MKKFNQLYFNILNEQIANIPDRIIVINNLSISENNLQDVTIEI